MHYEIPNARGSATSHHGTWHDDDAWFTTDDEELDCPEMLLAIDSGRDVVWCTDRRGDLVRVVTVAHSGGKYLKTENDGISQDNLLSQRDC